MVVSAAFRGFPSDSEVKNLPDTAEDVGPIPGLGRSPRKGNGNPCQYSCLGNPMNRGAWWSTVHGVTKELDITKQLNNNKFPLQVRPFAFAGMCNGAS